MKPDRWFYIGYYDFEPAEFTPLYRSWQLEVDPPAGWVRVSYEGPLAMIQPSGRGFVCRFGLEALNRMLDEELLAPPQAAL